MSLLVLYAGVFKALSVLFSGPDMHKNAFGGPHAMSVCHTVASTRSVCFRTKCLFSRQLMARLPYSGSTLHEPCAPCLPKPRAWRLLQLPVLLFSQWGLTDHPPPPPKKTGWWLPTKRRPLTSHTQTGLRDS